MKAGGSDVQDFSQLQEFKASLGYLRRERGEEGEEEGWKRRGGRKVKEREENLS